MAIISRSCERARNWVSLDLDDELSELEGAMLRAHTARCVPCAQFQAEAVAITHKLRLAPLEPLPAPIALPPRRRVVGRLLQVGAAAAVAALAAGIGALLSTSPQPSQITAPVGQPTAAQLSVAYLDAPQGLPQHPPLAFRSRIGLDPGRTDI
jgi:ferric-dicitrate binding protein FerR (iron transport regulator)